MLTGQSTGRDGQRGLWGLGVAGMVTYGTVVGGKGGKGRGLGAGE